MISRALLEESATVIPTLRPRALEQLERSGMPDVSKAKSPAELSQVSGRPRLDTAEATLHLRRSWGVAGELHPLESERDKNWMVAVNGRADYVLKVANADEDPDVVALQQTMMRLLRQAGLPCPEVVPASDGLPTADLNGYLGWLITVVPGQKLAIVPVPSESLYQHFGRVLGCAATALTDMESPAARRWLQWDVVHADQVLSGYRASVSDPLRGELLDAILDEFRSAVVPVLDDLPRSVIHNDANDHNVLVDGDRVSGLIDFGDAVHTLTVNDLAVGCAYAMLGRDDPWRVARAIQSGYCRERSLSALEAEVLPTLIRTRLATSVSISAYQQTLEPANPYLRISEQPVWDLLTVLMRG